MGHEIAVAVVGAGGRLGSLIVDVSKSRADVSIAAAIEAEASPLIGKTALAAEENKGHEVRFSASLSAALAACDVCIDCSSAERSVHTAVACAESGRPLIVLATGQTEQQLDALRSAASRIPVLIAPNASIGVFVLHELVKQAKRLLGPSYDIEIAEIHHKHKKDAPSGTALSLAKALAAPDGREIFTGRNEDSGERKRGEIGIAALRGGDIPGEHTVYFFGEGDRIELRHVARDRSIFARGALELATRMASKPHGLYDVAKLLQIPS